MILTIKAMQIASGKKNIAYAIFPGYYRLLSFVNTYCCYIKACIGAAVSQSPFEPVYPAFPGA
jgi:hypothetical protein